MKLTFSAPAKINLTLFLTGLREDGYHLLESVMQTLSLSDTLIFEKIPSGILLSCTKESLPCDEKNLCYRAAKMYLNEAGNPGGVKIHLIKCIPDGAGLGGGSSDAASVLKAMKTLYPADIDLLPLAAKLGADVPFFLTGGTSLCSGVGEKIKPLSFPAKNSLFCVVAKPEKGLSTPLVYSLYDQSKKPFSSPMKTKELALFEEKDPKKIFPLLQNDLELVAMTCLPEVANYKDALLSLGADAAQMSGSGSSVFGLFTDERKARECAKTLKNKKIEAYFCTLT